MNDTELSRMQNTIAESIRVEARRVANTLGLPRDAATAKLLAEACKNAAQTFQLYADCGLSGEPTESEVLP